MGDIEDKVENREIQEEEGRNRIKKMKKKIEGLRK